MEGTSQTVQGSGKGKVWVGKGRANQVGGVGRDVATFVVAKISFLRKGAYVSDIRVDGEVKSHEFNELGVVESDHVTVVGGPIETRVGGWKVSVLTVKVVENLSGDGRKVGNAVHAIFIDIFPVGGFVNTLSISLKESLVMKTTYFFTFANLDWEFMRVTAAEN